MTKKKNPSSPSSASQRIPVPDEFYDLAKRCHGVKGTMSRLFCGEKVARALKNEDRTLRITPLELEVMRLHVRHLLALHPHPGVCTGIKAPNKRQQLFINTMKAAAQFATEHAEEIRHFRTLSMKPNIYSRVAWHRPVYEFMLMMSKTIVPHLKQTWIDYPDCRELFFSGTGFAETFLTPKLRQEKIRTIIRRSK